MIKRERFVITMMKAATTTTTTTTVISAIIIITMAMHSTVLAQQQQVGEVFESEQDGFRLQIPQGWVIEDHDNLAYEGYSEEDIAMLCPASEALPAIGGEYNCRSANITDAIYISSRPDLQAVPEFEDLETPITTNDLLALSIQQLQEGNVTSDIQIHNNTDLDEFRKIVNVTLTRYNDAGTAFNPFDDFSHDAKGLTLFVLSEDRNTAYQIFNSMATPNIWNRTEHTPAVQEVFNTFQMVEGGE